MTDEMIWHLFGSIFKRFEAAQDFTQSKPLLAHYTSLNVLEKILHYLNGPRGVEPKLRFAIRPIDGLTDPDLSLEKIVNAILLGPSTSSPLAARSVARMLDVIGKAALKDRLFASTIPYRAM